MENGKKDKALVKNAADSQQVNNAAKKLKFQRENELKDLLAILETREGRRFLFRMVNVECHYDTNDFNTSGSVTYYSLGERNIGKVIKNDCIEASLELWQLAEKENWEYYKQIMGE